MYIVHLYKTAARPVLRLRVVDGDGLARDITGWSLSWRLGKLGVPGQGGLIEVLSGAGIALTDPADGVCEVTVSAALLAGVPAGAYTHELRRTDAGLEEVLGQGPAQVHASLSQ